MLPLPATNLEQRPEVSGRRSSATRQLICQLDLCFSRMPHCIVFHDSETSAPRLILGRRPSATVAILALTNTSEALLVLMLGAVYVFAGFYFLLNTHYQIGPRNSHVGAAMAAFLLAMCCMVVAHADVLGESRWQAGLRWMLESASSICALYTLETISGVPVRRSVVRTLAMVQVVITMTWLLDGYVEEDLTQTLWSRLIDVFGTSLLIYVALTVLKAPAAPGLKVAGVGTLLPAVVALAYYVFPAQTGTPRAVVPVSGVVFLCAITWYLLARYSANVEELRRRTVSLHSAYGRLLHTHTQLVQSSQMAAVGGLAAVVAHEVRNPLAIMQNAVAALRKSDGPQVNTLLTGILTHETSRMEHMARELLAFARPRPATFVSCDLFELASEAVRVVLERLRVQEPGLSLGAVHIAIDVDATSMWPRLDPMLIGDALERVVDNAFRAMPSGGLLRLDVLVDATALRFRVHDTGTGMTAETLSKAFEPFFTTRATGVGLGLTRAARIMEQHEGAIEIESQPTRGTIVTLLFPRHEAVHHPTVSA